VLQKRADRALALLAMIGDQMSNGMSDETHLMGIMPDAVNSRVEQTYSVLGHEDHIL
jgi:hypothetical protein